MMPNTPNRSTDNAVFALPWYWVLLVGLIQGAVLFWLTEVTALIDQLWQSALFTFALATPWMLLLAWRKTPSRFLFISLSLFGALLALLAAYVAHQVVNVGHYRGQGLLFAPMLTLGLAAFKGLLYCQSYAKNQKLHYADLFTYSWRNSLTFGLACLFALVAWGIFMLWAGLFKAIGIRFFDDLFSEQMFYLPLFTVSVAFGVALFKKLDHVIDAITRLLQALAKMLLPLLGFIAIIFLLALLANGLGALWDTRRGSVMVLWLQALLLFFLNATYQPQLGGRVYPLWLHRLVYVSVLTLPVYSVVSFIGLSARVGQYGWTLDRCWAFLVWGLLAIFSVGYLISIIRKRDDWLASLAWVNTAMGLVVLVVMLLINSPILDFRKITVASQMDRLYSDVVQAEDFDFHHLSRLARPGLEALEAAKVRYADQPSALKKIDRVLRRHDAVLGATHETAAAYLASMQVWPNNQSIPEALLAQLHDRAERAYDRDQYVAFFYVVLLDFNQNQTPEALLMTGKDQKMFMALYEKQTEQWKEVETRRIYDENTISAVIKNMQQGQFSAARPKWDHLEVGGFTIELDR